MKDLSGLNLVVLILAAFRLTHLVVYDGITEFIRRPFTSSHKQSRSYFPLRSWIGSLLNCYWCFGFWASVIVYGLYCYVPVLYPLLLVLAIAGAAAILQSIAKWLNPQEYL